MQQPLLCARSGRFLRALWRFGCGGGLCLTLALSATVAITLPGAAQGAAKKATAASDETRQWGDYSKTKKAVAAAADAEAGAQLYRDFLAAHAQLTPSVRATAWRDLALHQLQEQSDAAAATRTLQEAWAQLEANSKGNANSKANAKSKAFARLRLYLGQASVLEAQNQSSEALTLLQSPQVYDEMVGAGRGSWAGAQMEATAGVRRVLALLRAQNQEAQGEALVARFLSDAPELLDEAKQRTTYNSASGVLYRAVVELLQRQNKGAAALGWVRLRLMTCEFSAAALESTTSQVSRALGEGGDLARVKAFLSAQEDASLPNPLAQAVLPVLDEARLQARVEELRRRVNSANSQSGPVHALNSALIAQGRLGEAMGRAQELWLGRITSPEGAAEVARVFKAADLSVARSNAFLAYVKGEGANPLPAFFEQFPNTAGEAG